MLDSTQRYNQTVPDSGMHRCIYHRSIQVTHPLHLFVVDPAGNVKGMYRLLDLIGESGSNGYGKSPFLDIKPIALYDLIIHYS